MHSFLHSYEKEGLPMHSSIIRTRPPYILSILWCTSMCISQYEDYKILNEKEIKSYKNPNSFTPIHNESYNTFNIH